MLTFKENPCCHVYFCTNHKSQDMESIWFICLFVYFWWGWGLNSEVCARMFNQWTNKEDVIYTHTHSAILFSHKQVWNPDICASTDRTEGHYFKWNKSGTERQITHVLTYMYKWRKIS
jgi:hypothetical protein